MKRITWLLIAAMVLTLFAGCMGQKPTTTSATTAVTTAANTAGESTKPVSEKLFSEPVTFTMILAENPSYPYKKDSLLEREIGKRYNVFFDVTPIQGYLEDKVNLYVASGDLPDLICDLSPLGANAIGNQGALINFNKYRDKMPNYAAWAKEHGDYETYFFGANGELFSMPNLGYGEAGNATHWIYRKDVFEANGIKPATTDDEFYQVLKELKRIYPESYPLVFRSYQYAFDRMSYQWGGTSYGMYFDNDTKSWVYGPVEEEFKECVIFFKKLFDEDLIPPNFLSMDTNTWVDYLSTDKGFVTNDYMARIDMFNGALRKENPNYSLAYMPPFKGGKNGTDKFNPQSCLIIGGASGFSGSKKVDEIVKYLDSRYTDEAMQLMSWGVEGESYEVRNDGKKYHLGITGGFLDVPNKYGIFQTGFYTLVDPWAMQNYASEETKEAAGYIATQKGEYSVPSNTFSAEAQEQRSRIETNLMTIMYENISKFITGQRSLDQWDQYVKELKSLGLDELVKLYNDSYKEFKSKF